jgi:hypothetical protein
VFEEQINRRANHIELYMNFVTSFLFLFQQHTKAKVGLAGPS